MASRALQRARIALCLEQTLGHRAHTANLENAITRCRPESVVVKVEPGGRSLVPWAVAGSWGARVRMGRQAGAHDVRFFHTQSIALFAPVIRPRTPFVISVDATPVQMDAIGRWYDHRTGNRLVERAKQALYRSVFGRASAMVAWSHWAAESLAEDYGVAPERILVAHPGAPSSFFAITRHCPAPSKPTILFVGGDLERKGGDLLIDTFRGLSEAARLILVTSAPIEPDGTFEVVRDATPGSQQLLDAYRQADIFCLPTRGDCTPVVLGEAMAAGLPVVTTRIGSNGETVADRVDGLLIDVDDGRALRFGLERLIGDPALRCQMGAAARAKARARFDADRNAARIFRLLESLT